MIPRPAQYLLRFDDLCPTVHHRRWQRLANLIREFGIQPIIAVVPDNRDKELQCSPPDPGFWAQMREIEAAGATIAVHGYQHLCETSGKDLLGIHHRTEFAGLSLERQRQWIASGLKILREHGLTPRLWVAPRHSFDMNTLLAVRKEGLRYISDGLARVPFTRGGVTWIPQQLWSPVSKSEGLWTICIHSNSARVPTYSKLRLFLGNYSEQFTSFDRVIADFEPSELPLSERMYELYASFRLRMHRNLARRRRRVTN
jgi:predicted deacetylase